MRSRSWEVVKAADWAFVPLESFGQGGDIITAGPLGDSVAVTDTAASDTVGGGGSPVRRLL